MYPANPRSHTNQLVLTFFGFFFFSMSNVLSPISFNSPKALKPFKFSNAFPTSFILCEIPFPIIVNPPTFNVSIDTCMPVVSTTLISFLLSLSVLIMVIPPTLIVSTFCFVVVSCWANEKSPKIPSKNVNNVCFIFVFLKKLLCNCQLKIRNLYIFYLI